MNKKIIILIIAVIVLIGGIFFLLSLKNNNTAVNNLAKTSKPQEIENNLVEVFYLPHPPIDPIRQKIKSILQKFPKYELKEYDFDDKNNKQKIENYNLTGHIPVAIFINGTDVFLINGQKITFKNFPKGDAFVPSLEGSWDYNDLEKVLADPVKYKND